MIVLFARSDNFFTLIVNQTYFLKAVKLTFLGQIVRLKSKMEAKTLNYRIIIEPDIYPDTKKRCFNAHCPTLGLADYGNTVEKALKNIKNLIKFHIESLNKDNKDIPTSDPETEFITIARVKVEPKITSPV